MVNVFASRVRESLAWTAASEVEGHNLHIVVPLARWEAAQGTSIEVPTLTGKIALTIPSGSQAASCYGSKVRGWLARKKPAICTPFSR